MASPSEPTSSAVGRPSLFSLLKAAASEWIEDNCMRLAASLSFYAFLSMAPLLVLIVRVASLFLRNDAAQGKVAQEMSGFVGSAGAQAIADMIKAGSKPGAGRVATIVSIIILILSATGVFAELQDSMNLIFEVRPKPNQGIWNVIRTRFLSLLMIFGSILILLLSLGVSTTVAALAGRLGPGWALLFSALDILVSLGVLTLLFALMFRVLPDVEVPWRYVWMGAVLSAVLFVIGKYGMALYFKYGSTTSAYGAAGSLAAVLIWVYYSAQLLFFGAEFTQVQAKMHGHAFVPNEHAVRLTERERIDAGIPHEATLAAAAAGPAPQAASWGPRGMGPSAGRRGSRLLRPTYGPGPAVAVAEEDGRASGWKTVLAAGAGIAVGAALGAVEMMRRGRAPARPFSRQHLAAIRLDARLDNVERRLGAPPRRLRDSAGELRLGQRIDELEDRMRSVARRTLPPRRPPAGRSHRGWQWLRTLTKAFE